MQMPAAAPGAAFDPATLPPMVLMELLRALGSNPGLMQMALGMGQASMQMAPVYFPPGMQMPGRASALRCAFAVLRTSRCAWDGAGPRGWSGWRVCATSCCARAPDVHAPAAAAGMVPVESGPQRQLGASPEVKLEQEGVATASQAGGAAYLAGPSAATESSNTCFQRSASVGEVRRRLRAITCY
jgi:hypothetical protein